MEELNFLEKIKLIGEYQPGLIGVTLAIMVAMLGKFGKSFGELFAGIILFIALIFQFKAATKENLYKLKTNLSISCMEKKLEALNNDKTININELKIDTCDKLDKIKSI